MRIIVIPEDIRAKYEELLPEEHQKSATILIAAGEQQGGEFDVQGIAAFTDTGEGIWELSYIHVVSEYRAEGLGGKLINYAFLIIRNLGGDNIVASYLRDKDSAMLDRCLTKTHFKEVTNSKVMGAKLTAFEDGVRSYGALKKAINVIPLCEAGEDDWQALEKIMEELDENSEDDEVYPVFYSMDTYSPQMSMLVKSSEGFIKGAILFEQTGNTLSVSYLWVKRGNGAIVAAILSASLDEALRLNPPETIVTWHGLNPSVGKITERLLAGTDGAREIGNAVVMQHML